LSEEQVHDELVLIRTTEGQRLVFDEEELDATRRRLLRLVNGYTSLSDLTSRLDPNGDWGAAARTLLLLRLVEISTLPSRDFELSPVVVDNSVDKGS
jgi:hypothetical protein